MWDLKFKWVFLLIVIGCFSFNVSHNNNTVEISDKTIDSLYSKSTYVLKVQVLKKENDEQWSKGYTDYHVECLIRKDFKNNYPDKKVLFHHRVDGDDGEDILQKQLGLGQEYIVFLDSSHTTISEGTFKNGEFTVVEKKVFVLTDNYKGVLPFDSEIEAKIK